MSPDVTPEQMAIVALNAARYVWLRDRMPCTTRNAAGTEQWIYFRAPLPEGMDAAIDREMATSRECSICGRGPCSVGDKE